MTLLSSLKSSIASFLSRCDLLLFDGKEDGFVVIGTATPTQSVTINPLKAQAALVAPYQVTLEANVTDFGVEAGGAGEWDPQYHDIEYIWSVEEVGNPSYATSTYTAPVNVPAANRVKGTKYGKRIVHVIGRDDVTPGAARTFRFICTAVNLATGISATSAAYERTIEHPDDYFGPLETFIVRASGSTATDYPTTSQALRTSIQDAISLVSARTVPDNLTKYRICIEKGQTCTGIWQNFVYLPTIYFDTWGSSADKPIWPARMEPFRNMTNTATCTTAVLYGIKMEHPDYWLQPGSGAFASTERCFTVDSMESEGVDFGYHSPASDTGSQFWVWHNCVAENFGNFAGLGNGGKTGAFIGCRWNHTNDQTSDNRNSGGFGLRALKGSDLIYVSQCDAFIRQGWFDNDAPIQTSQPAIRLFTDSGTNRAGWRIHVERCIFEALSVGLGEEAQSQRMNVLAERNIIIGLHDNFRGLLNFGSGATVRNNLFIFPPSRNAQNKSNFNASKAVQFEYTSGGSSDPRSDPCKVYNNTMIYLGNGTAPVMATGASYTITEANNVVHTPFAATPVSAGSFNLTELFTPRYDGYDDRRGTPQDPQYLASVNSGTLSGTFQIGETVRGQTSLVEKVLSAVDVSMGLSINSYLFEATTIFGTFADNPSFERFTASETLEGLTSGATIQMRANMGSTQTSADSGYFLVGLIPKTITPTHFILYDAETGAFTEGETLTGAGGATALICQVWDDGTTGRLWLRNVSGTFVDNETITDGATGSATANGAAQSAGTGALWTLTTSTARDAGTWATDPFTRRDFLGAETTLRGALAS